MQSNIGVISAYGTFWRYYSDFGSRTSKEAFWKAWVIHIFISFVLTIPIFHVYKQIIEYGDLLAGLWLIPAAVYGIATIIPTIAIVIRRLHDIDRSGCWFFLFLVPFVGQIVFFVMLVRQSAPYDMYPGMSGKGPYSNQYGQQPYVQQPYVQQQYAPPPYTQQQYGQQQYGQPMYNQQPYAQPYPQYHPLPPPRNFKPAAGTGRALVSIVLSVIITASSMAYNIVVNTYLQSNYVRYMEAFLGDLYTGRTDNPYWNYGDDYYGDYGDDYYGDYPLDDDFWDDYGEYDDYYLTEEEQEAIDAVRGSTLPGFPYYSIEEVLSSRADVSGFSWDCFEDDSTEYPSYYVSVTGLMDGSFFMMYAGFSIYEDGTIEIFNLDDGERDEYEEDAVEFYSEWYDALLSGNANFS